MTDHLEFGLLGPLKLEYQGKEITIGGPRQRTALAMLLLNPDRVVSVDRMSEAIWNGRPPATARTQVAICIAELRKTFRAVGIRDDVVITASPGYMLRRANHRIDLMAFREQVAEARELADRQEHLRATETYDEALALWRGRALCDISSAVLEIEVERLQEHRLAVLEDRNALHLHLGRHRELISELTALVEEQPLREQTRAQLMLAQYRSGRRAEATETYRQGRQHFVDEIGLEPGPALRELHEAILQDAPSLREPVQQHTTQVESVSPCSLPPATPEFLGREAECAELDALLGTPSGIGLITGPSGVGKSALAVHWARSVAEHFPGGLVHVDASATPVTPGSGGVELLGAVLTQLGMSTADIPTAPLEATALYRRVTETHATLVVLDNVGSFEEIERLLPVGSTSRLLITAHRHLDPVIGRGLWLRLAPLPLRSATELLGTLIGERADRDRESVAELAELCDRLPAALHIAATRLLAKPHWTVQRLLGRLRDPRNRLAHLDHSGELRARLRYLHTELTGDAAEMFGTLGCLDATEFSLSELDDLARTSPHDVEDLVEQLVEFHLVEGVTTSGEEARYRMLPLLRLFARELHPTGGTESVVDGSFVDVKRPKLIAAGGRPELKCAI